MHSSFSASKATPLFITFCLYQRSILSTWWPMFSIPSHLFGRMWDATESTWLVRNFLSTSFLGRSVHYFRSGGGGGGGDWSPLRISRLGRANFFTFADGEDRKHWFDSSSASKTQFRHRPKIAFEWHNYACSAVQTLEYGNMLQLKALRTIIVIGLCNFWFVAQEQRTVGNLVRFEVAYLTFSFL